MNEKVVPYRPFQEEPQSLFLQYCMKCFRHPLQSIISSRFRGVLGSKNNIIIIHHNRPIAKKRCWLSLSYHALLCLDTLVGGTATTTLFPSRTGPRTRPRRPRLGCRGRLRRSRAGLGVGPGRGTQVRLAAAVGQCRSA